MQLVTSMCDEGNRILQIVFRNNSEFPVRNYIDGSQMPVERFNSRVFATAIIIVSTAKAVGQVEY